MIAVVSLASEMRFNPALTRRVFLLVERDLVARVQNDAQVFSRCRLAVQLGAFDGVLKLLHRTRPVQAGA